MAGPTVGQVIDGYRFKGGDPNDQAAWERAAPASGAEAAGYTDLGSGWFRGPDGGTYQQNRRGEFIHRSGGANGDEGSQRNSRRDFEGLAPVKAFREAQSYFGSIQDAVNASDGASDQVLVIAFNKMLDPTSVVREGEYDRAKDIAGAFEGLRLQADRAMTGNGLTPRMRQQIAEAAQSMYEVRRDQYNDLAERYQGLAAEDGLNPRSVAREEFGGQRITKNPAYQEEGQANQAQDRARRAIPGYDRQSPLGSETRPYIASPGVNLENLPSGSSYIDIDGSMKTVGGVAQGRETAIDISDPALDRNQLVALLANGGWVRNGDGEPYQVGAGTVRPGSPGDGAVEVRPGVFQDAAQGREAAIEARREGNPIIRGADAVVRGVADGGTFGFADRIAAGANTILPLDRGSQAFWQDGAGFGDAYENNIKLQRGLSDSDNEDVQGLRRTGQAIGMIAGGSSVARAGVSATERLSPRLAQSLRLAPAVPNATQGANAVRLAQNAGRVAVASAPMGAAAGAGYTREGGAGDMAMNALKGGGMAALGGPVVGAIASRVAPPVVNALAGGLRTVGRAAGSVGTAMGVPGANALSARSAAPSPLGGALDMFGAKVPVEANALNAEAANWRANNIEPTFFDVVGDGGQGVGRALATRQTPGRQVAVDFGARRRVGAQDRVSDIARRNISDDPRTSSQVADALEQEQSTLSAAAMDPIRDEMVQVSPETATVFRTPGGRAAIEQARAWAANSRQSEELAALARLADDSLDAPGNIQISLGTMDRLRRSLSNQARSASDGDTRQGLTSLSRDVRRDATTATPAYGQFLNDYAERAQLDDALEFGGQFLGRRGTEDFARRGAEMLPAQNQVARVAARETVEEAGNTPAGAARVLDDLSVGRGRGQRADGLLGDDAERLRSNADYGRRELETGRNISPRTGSQTNDNMQNSALANGVSTGIMVARDVATGNKYNLAARAVDFMRNRGFSDQQAEALLTAGLDPARTDELIAAFMQTGLTRREARNAARTARHLAATGTGSTQTAAP